MQAKGDNKKALEKRNTAPDTYAQQKQDTRQKNVRK
jgi:hypothetical protein